MHVNHPPPGSGGGSGSSGSGSSDSSGSGSDSSGSDSSGSDSSGSDSEDAAELFRLLLEGVGDHALVLLDEGGRVSAWNAGAQRIFGYSEKEALGRPGALLFTPEDRAAGEPEKELERAALAGRAEDTRWHVRKDGSRFWADGTTYALREQAAGALRGFCKIVRDRTEQKLAQEALLAGLARESRIARTLQESLLLAPSMDSLRGLEVAPFYEPALDEALVGGDFFDAFPVDGAGPRSCWATPRARGCWRPRAPWRSSTRCAPSSRSTRTRPGPWSGSTTSCAGPAAWARWGRSRPPSWRCRWCWPTPPAASSWWRPPGRSRP